MFGIFKRKKDRRALSSVAPSDAPATDLLTNPAYMGMPGNIFNYALSPPATDYSAPSTDCGPSSSSFDAGSTGGFDSGSCGGSF